MFTLLDETDQRRLSVLRLLFQHADWITVGEIAQSIGASERTAQSDITYIKNKWNGKLNIEVSQKQGVHLCSRSSAVQHEITTDVFNNSVVLRFLRDLIFHPGKSLEFYYAKLFVSKSTLLRQMPKIEEYLASMDVSIEKTSGLYRLCSVNEQYLRKLLAEFYVELNLEVIMRHKADTRYVLPYAAIPIDAARLSRVVRNLIRQIDRSERGELICQDDVAVAQMAVFYLISLVRENQGFHAKSDRAFANELSEEDYGYFQTLFPHIRKENIQPIHALIAEIVEPPDSAEEALLVQSAADVFFQKLFKDMSVTCPAVNLQKLQGTLCILYSYVKACPLTVKGIFGRLNSFASSLETSNPALYKAFQSNLTQFSKSTNTDMTPVLPDLINKSFYYFPDLCRATHLKRILVLSDSGLSHAAFLSRYIQSSFNGRHFTAVDVRASYYGEALNSASFDSYGTYDILITTTLALPCIHLFKRVILFEDIPSTASLLELYNAIYLS